MSQFHSAGQMLRFGLVGIANTVVGLSGIFAAQRLGLGAIAANAFGYGCGLSASFALNRRWTFSHRGSLAGGALRFCVVVLMAWTINVTLVLFLIHLGIPAGFAQVAGVMPYTAAIYVGCRYWAFTPTPSMQPRQYIL